MTTIKQALTDYINVRRGLGFQLRKPASLLRNFVEFLQAAGSSYITTNLALRWATQPTQAEPACRAARLGMVRRFAIWYSAIEPRTAIPLRTFFLITIGVSPLTFTPMRRSTESFTELDNCLRLGDSVPARLQPSLVCW